MRAREPTYVPLSASPGQRWFVHRAGLDSHRSNEIHHKNPSVPGSFGLRVACNGVDHLLHQAIRDDHFDLYLGHKDGGKRVAVVPFLPPFWCPNPLTSETVIPSTPIPINAVVTSSNLNGCMMASMIFISIPPYELGAPEDAARSASLGSPVDCLAHCGFSRLFGLFGLSGRRGRFCLLVN